MSEASGSAWAQKKADAQQRKLFIEPDSPLSRKPRDWENYLPIEAEPTSDGPTSFSPLFAWMEDEVVARLARLDARMEQLTSRLEWRSGGPAVSLALAPTPAVKEAGQERQYLAASAPSIMPKVAAAQAAARAAAAMAQERVTDVWAVADSIASCEKVDKSGSPVHPGSDLSTASPEPDGHSESGGKSQSPRPLDHGDDGNKEAFCGMSFPFGKQKRRSSGRSSGFQSVRVSLSGHVAIGQRVLKKRTMHLGHTREKIVSLLNDPESSRAASWYANTYPVFTLTAVFLTLLQSNREPFLHGMGVAVAEATFDAVFLLEVVVRFWVAPSRSNFLHNLHNCVDLIAALPLGLRVAIGFELPAEGAEGLEGFGRAVLLCLVPVVRLLKTLRRFSRFELLVKAVELTAEALPVCMFSLLLLTLCFSSAIYLVEPRDNIDSLPAAMWLTIVTMTTVGYGDITPTSAVGSIVVSVLVITSVLYMAMPLGIMGQAFTSVWGDRDKIMLLKCTQDRLVRWGYSATDIKALFEMFDKDGNRELELEEFERMMKAMRIGLAQDRIYDLFKSFDADGSGSVDDKEFVRQLFPSEYRKIYPPE